jgi:ankyrin repeat protein
MFAKKLLSLCSKNFSDKDGEFTGIPLQTMMLGEAFVTEAVEYCSKGEIKLPEKFNLLDLFNKFWGKKCDIYFEEKNAMDSSKPEVKVETESYLGKHMIASLISLFSLSEENEFLGAINVSQLEQAKSFLGSGMAEKFGIIREVTDGKPQFIHRCFAEYFAAKWFSVNYSECENFISNNLFKSTYEVTRNIFDRMLAAGFEMHSAVLNNDIDAVEELLKIETNINLPDKGGRTALHLAAYYNRPITGKLLSIPVVDANKPDAVLKWTPLSYADRMKSWMAMDILLGNGANAKDIVLTRRKSDAQDWGQRALWECASQGYTQLLEFIFECGTDVNIFLEVPENIPEQNSLLHIASNFCQLEVVRILVERMDDINIINAEHDTALHSAARSGNAEIITILLDKGMSVDLTNVNGSTPLHLSAQYAHLEATKALVNGGASLKNADKDGFTPLLCAANEGNLHVFHYLIELGADININTSKRNNAIHLAAISGSVEIIKILLDKGISVDLTNTEDSTPLHSTARNGNLEATKTLVERGASLKNADKDGFTPLLRAAM